MSTRSKHTGELISLADNSHKKKRYESPSQHRNYWLGTKARLDDGMTRVSNYKSAKNASDVYQETRHPIHATPRPIADAILPEFATDVKIELKLRRAAIRFFYLAYFKDHSIDQCVPPIRKLCKMSKGSTASLRKLLQEIKDEENGYQTPPKKTNVDKRVIRELSPEANIVYYLTERGISCAQIAAVLNIRALKQAAESGEDKSDAMLIGKDAVYGFVKRSPIIHKYRRLTMKTGKRDADSQWAKARVIQCQHYLNEMAMNPQMIGPWKPHHIPLILDQIVWFDEKHRKCVLGCNSKHEYLIARNTFDDMPTEPEFGGVFPPRMPTTKEKFPEEARACFGAAFVTLPDGTEKGVKADPYDYTGRFVLGLRTFNQKITEELARVKPLKGQWGMKGHGYEERYGDNWKDKVHEQVNKKYCCIIDIMKWAIEFGNWVHKDLPSCDTWRLFHDHLKQWWEKDAQAWMEENYPGMVARQLRVGLESMPEIYRGKCVGDSPELCRILDSHGFSDLENSISHHVALSSFLPFDDTRRFNLGTPKEVMRTMKRCWEIAPSSEQIVAYAKRYSEILKLIVEADGVMIPGEALRSGRRLALHDGKAGNLKKRLYSNNRTALLQARALHPDVQFIQDHILESKDGVIKIEDAIEEFQRKQDESDKRQAHEEAAEAMMLLLEIGGGRNGFNPEIELAMDDDEDDISVVSIDNEDDQSDA